MTDISSLIDQLKNGSDVRKRHAMKQLAEAEHDAIQQLVDAVAGTEESLIDIMLLGVDWEQGEGQRSDPPYNLLRDTVGEDFWFVAALSSLLAKIGPAAAKAILPVLSHEKPFVRAWAAHTLGTIGDNLAVGPLISSLRTARNEELIRVIEALGKLQADQAVEQLIEFLEDESAGVQSAAALALAHIGDLRALMPLIEQLKKHKPSVYAVSAALHHFGEHATEPLIQVLFDNEAHRVHDLVLMKLSMLGDDRAIEPILEVLENTQDPKIRGSAIASLGRLKANQAVNPIARILHTTTDFDIRLGSAMAIAKIGGTNAFDTLLEALEHGSLEVKRQAALAFGEMGKVDDIKPLLQALAHEDHHIRSGMAVALGNLRDIRAVDALRQALNDPDEATRRYAAGALEKIAGSDSD